MKITTPKSQSRQPSDEVLLQILERQQTIERLLTEQAKKEPPISRKEPERKNHEKPTHSYPDLFSIIIRDEKTGKDVYMSHNLDGCIIVGREEHKEADGGRKVTFLAVGPTPALEACLRAGDSGIKHTAKELMERDK